ncbi:MAG: hypothetical protein NTV34_12470 [Proteobacteria bacterium]|nr:hypothetical protein [Pseudomonadota bacterium]
MKDESVRERAANIAYPAIIIWEDIASLLGSGPSESVLAELKMNYQDKLAFGDFFVSSRISSGWGTAIFQLGLVGILWALLLTLIAATQTTAMASFTGIGFMLLMWTAIPWATPLVGIICGLLFKGTYFRLQKEEKVSLPVESFN